MNYESFKDELLKKLKELVKSSDVIGETKFYEEGMVAKTEEEKSFVKNTNIKYHQSESDILEGDFIGIESKKSKGTLCRFDVHNLFDNYKVKGWDYLLDTINKNLNYSSTVDVDGVMKQADNFEAIKDKLIVRPLNFSDNRLSLVDCIYRRVGDMALVLYFYINTDDVYGLTTVKVKKIVFDKWGKDPNEVIELALINSNVMAVPRMYNSPTDMVNPRYEVGAYMALGAEYGLTIASTFTTYPSTNGAISFWYPGVSEKLAEMAGGDYYVEFTGIHDFHIHPVNTMTAREVLRSLKNMNKNANQTGETLSRKVYKYISATMELKMLEL